MPWQPWSGWSRYNELTIGGRCGQVVKLSLRRGAACGEWRRLSALAVSIAGPTPGRLSQRGGRPSVHLACGLVGEGFERAAVLAPALELHLLPPVLRLRRRRFAAGEEELGCVLPEPGAGVRR